MFDEFDADTASAREPGTVLCTRDVLLDKLELERFDDGELTGMKPPKSICKCCSDMSKFCRSLPSRPANSGPSTFARLAAAAALRSPALVADEDVEPGGGGLFK